MFKDSVYKEKMTNQILGLRIPDRKKGDKRIYKKRCFDYCNKHTVSQKINSKVEANFYY